jgi:SAM-dependent methyltransferase
MQSQIKSVARRITPAWLRQLRTQWLVARQRRNNQNRPIKDVFDEIYQRSEWGAATPGAFYSGTGSTEQAASVYAQTIRTFIQDRHITRVLDLGCGDFSVGRQFQMEGVQYIGVDIVESVIQRIQQQYGTSSTSFQCLDVLMDDLPDADLCLIRQVIQHLSNAEIMTVVERIIRSKKYPYVIVTEHYPAPGVKARPNVDKPHGPDTRIVDGSAVYLDRPPFNVPNLQLILEVDEPKYLVNEGEKIRSFLIER